MRDRDLIDKLNEECEWHNKDNTRYVKWEEKDLHYKNDGGYSRALYMGGCWFSGPYVQRSNTLCPKCQETLSEQNRLYIEYHRLRDKREDTSP